MIEKIVKWILAISSFSLMTLTLMTLKVSKELLTMPHLLGVLFVFLEIVVIMSFMFLVYMFIYVSIVNLADIKRKSEEMRRVIEEIKKLELGMESTNNG